MEGYSGKVLSTFAFFCSATVKVTSSSPGKKKKKWIIHSADFQDYYIIQFSGMLQSGCPVRENLHPY